MRARCIAQEMGLEQPQVTQMLGRQRCRSWIGTTNRLSYLSMLIAGLDSHSEGNARLATCHSSGVNHIGRYSLLTKARPARVLRRMYHSSAS